MRVNSGLLTPVSLPVDKESVDILNRQLQKSWLIEGIMGHFIKWGNVINQKKKCLPSLMFIFLYLIVPWCINGLGGQECRQSNWD